MRVCSFIVVIEESPPNTNFSLKDLPGASKIDVVARNVQIIFPQKTSKYLVRYFAVFTKKTPMVLVVPSILGKEEFSDEIEIASIIRTALEDQPMDFKLELINNLTNPTFYNLTNFKHLFQELQKNEVKFIYLHEEGAPYKELLCEISQCANICFILGGRRDISNEHESLLQSLNPLKISLGSTSYLASTCILKVIYELNKI